MTIKNERNLDYTSKKVKKEYKKKLKKLDLNSYKNLTVID